MPIIPKYLMTEEDIKLNYITPSLLAKGWKDKITMETKVQFTDGKVNIQGNVTVREPAKKADYILYLNANNPIAVVEAKDNNHSVSFGIQQAMTYATMLDVPFAYSSNGDGFYEHDFLTGIEREIGLDEFPTYDELSIVVSNITLPLNSFYWTSYHKFSEKGDKRANSNYYLCRDEWKVINASGEENQIIWQGVWENICMRWEIYINGMKLPPYEALLRYNYIIIRKFTH